MMPPILDDRSAEEATQKARWLQTAFELPFLLENPPFAAVAGKLHLLHYMRRVAEGADCGLVLDIGHLLTYQRATGRAFDDSIIVSGVLQHVAELHMAGLWEITTPQGVQFLDRHDLPIREDCWEFLEKYLPAMVNLKGITLEQERCAPDLIAAHVKRLHGIVRKRKPSAWN
jgi:uncharacterized protein (UPF0276 family)